jgi:hypothetical protein
VLLDKTGLGGLRLVSFFALAVILRRYLPANGVLTANRWCQPILKCGRFSLNVFSFGALLSSVTAVSWVLTSANVAVQTTAAIVGVGLQLGYAAWKDQRKQDAVERERAETCRLRLLTEPVGEPVPLTVPSEPPRQG